MPKRTRFAEYKDSYANFSMELDEQGILLLTQHTDGGSLSWNAEVHDRMADVFADISGDRSVHCVIHTGAGPNYNADWAFLPVGSTDGKPVELPKDWAPPVQFMGELGWFGVNMLVNLLEIEAPVIAAVNGPAYGGGFCLTLGADIRIAGTSARFRGAGINNGLTGTELGISYLLPRLIGASRANEIILSGREVDAVEAERIGLVSRVVPDETLVEAALDLAESIAGFSAHGVSMTKQVLWSNLETASLRAAIDLENRNQLLVRLTTDNLAEAIRARREKRKPNYKD